MSGDGAGPYYVICSTQRSGSSVLCHLLRQTDALGYPLEYFASRRILRLQRHFSVRTFAELLDALKHDRSTENGVFGFKAHYGQFEHLASMCDVRVAFPDLKFVLIQRQDLLMQAVSLFKARRTRQFDSKRESKREAHYKFAGIRRALDDLLVERAKWQAFFTLLEVGPLVVTYEDILHDADAVVRRIAHHVGITGVGAVSLDQVDIKVQRDETSHAWREQAKRDFADSFFGKGRAARPARRERPKATLRKKPEPATRTAAPRKSREPAPRDRLEQEQRRRRLTDWRSWMSR